MWKEKFQKRCCLPINGKKKKKNLGSDRTQGRLTGQQNQVQFPSCCEHDDNSCIKGKEWIEYSQAWPITRRPLDIASLLWQGASLLLFSCPVLSDSLRPYKLQHARPPCALPSPKVCPSSCPLHRWCHPAISFSDALFSSYPQSFPASGTFKMSQLFSLGDQNTSPSASVLPMNIQGWFPLRLTGLISLLSKGLSRVFSDTIVWGHQFFGILPSLWSSSHNCMWR